MKPPLSRPFSTGKELNMTTCNPFMELSDQLGYVQCSFCATILLVSVPCGSRLLNVVTVKCGHCTCLLSVSLVRAASFLPFHLLASLGDDHNEEKHEIRGDALPEDFVNGEEEEEEKEESTTLNPIVVNKPPEKRQRAPSAYNRFIKEEIQRIKAREPNITHKQAFSAAAKNWAHFPGVQLKQQENCGESCSSVNNKATSDEVDRRCQGFREREASRQSMHASSSLQ